VSDADVNDVVVPVSAGSTVTGNVRLEDGTPATAAISVVYRDAFSSLVGGALIKNARPDATGHFSVEGLPPGEYSLAASALTDWTYLKSLNSREVTLSAPPFFKVDGVGSTELDVVLSKHAAAATGTVQDAKEGLVVLKPASADARNPEFLRVTQLDADGRFALHGLTPGAYKICAWDYASRALSTLAADPEFLSRFLQCTSLTLDEDASPTVELTPLDRQLTEQAIAASR
jgi:hypothetical protein